MSWFGRAFPWVGTSSWLLQLGTAVLAITAPALAADWSLKFGASESLTVDDNLDLEEVDRDAALVSSTSFDLNLLATAKTSKLGFAPRVNVQKIFFSREPEDWSYFPSGSLFLSKWTELTTFDLVANYSKSEASSNELVEGVFTEDEGDQINYAVTGTITHKLNERNTLLWSNAVSMVDYTLPSDDLVPALTATSTGTWRHDVTELVSTSLTGSAQYYDPDSATTDEYMVYRATPGINARLTKRLSVSAAAGAVILDPADDNVVVDIIFNVSGDYKLKDTSYTLSAARDLAPSQDGTLDDTYSARLGVSHQVNDLLTLGLSSSYVFQKDEEEGDSRAFTVSPSLHYQLSRDWTSSLSYRFVHTDDETETAYSNAVTLSLSYGTFLLP